jgi:hypothetical protein
MCTALVAGLVAVVGTHPDLLPEVFDSSTSYLTELARTARDLLTR